MNHESLGFHLATGLGLGVISFDPNKSAGGPFDLDRLPGWACRPPQVPICPPFEGIEAFTDAMKMDQDQPWCPVDELQGHLGSKVS